MPLNKWKAGPGTRHAFNGLTKVDNKIDSTMNALRIDAASQESAHGMMDALRGFGARLIEDDQGQQVVVSLGASPRRIVEVLNALERYVTARADGPARIELEGRHYTLHPEPTD